MKLVRLATVVALAFGVVTPSGADSAVAPTAAERNARPDVDDTESRLLLACAQGDVTTVDALLAQGVSVHITEPRRGASLLHVAAAQGHDKIVAKLLAAGARPQSLDNDGANALVYAAYEGHASIVQRLIAAGSDVIGVPRGAPSPLAAAVYSGSAQAVHLLLRAGANPDLKEATGLTVREVAANAQRTDILNVVAVAGSGLK